MVRSKDNARTKFQPLFEYCKPFDGKLEENLYWCLSKKFVKKIARKVNFKGIDQIYPKPYSQFVVKYTLY